MDARPAGTPISVPRSAPTVERADIVIGKPVSIDIDWTLKMTQFGKGVCIDNDWTLEMTWSANL